ncbi:MAG: EpsI family protein [Candidatus Eiseniibacteriota bacterium]|nr:MAG: EpsI family protein [Candidatus Eisenbacteria bacterium]
MAKAKGFYIVLVLLVATLAYAQLIGLERGGVLSLEPAAFLPTLAGWQGEEASLRDFEEALLKPDSHLYLRYATGQELGPVYVFLGYFRDQRIGVQIHSPINCLPGSGWNLVRAEEYEPPRLGFRVRRLVAERSGEYREVYYWFVTASGTTSSEYRLKLAQLKSGLLLRSKDALFVRISVSGTGDEVLEHMSAFIPEFARTLNAFLGASGWEEKQAVLRSR